jgi:hypothetical protein
MVFCYSTRYSSPPLRQVSRCITEHDGYFGSLSCYIDDVAVHVPKIFSAISLAIFSELDEHELLHQFKLDNDLE